MTTTNRFEREALPQLPALQQFALHLCKDPHRTDDLVQETMLKACTYFHTYRDGTNCRAWLFQICKNAFINEYRRRHYETIPVDFQGEDAPGARTQRFSHCYHIDQHAGDGDIADEIASALSSLPDDYHTVLVLCDIEGHTYEEIAEFVSAPIGTVRSRIHRGRKMMADRLQHVGRRFRQSHDDRFTTRH